MGKIGYLIAAVFVVVAGWLLFSAMQQGTSLVLSPSELRTQTSAAGKPQDKTRIRVAGRVAPLPIEYKLEPEIELNFYIVDPKPATKKETPGADSSSYSASMTPTVAAATTPEPLPVTPENIQSLGAIPVTYKKLKPDMFAAGRDVIIDGNFINGKVEALNLLTQCPSKYEPPNATEQYTGTKGHPKR